MRVCTNSAIDLPANTLFSVMNLPGQNTQNKYLIIWNNTAQAFQRKLTRDYVDGWYSSDGANFQRETAYDLASINYPAINQRSLSAVFTGRLSPKAKLMVLDKPLMMSGNLQVFKDTIGGTTYNRYMARPTINEDLEQYRVCNEAWENSFWGSLGL